MNLQKIGRILKFLVFCHEVHDSNGSVGGVYNGNFVLPLNSFEWVRPPVSSLHREETPNSRNSVSNDPTYLQRISKLDFCFIDRMSIGGYKIVIRADKRPLQQTYANSSNCNCGCCQKIGNVRFCARTSRYWKITINTLSRHETHR